MDNEKRIYRASLIAEEMPEGRRVVYASPEACETLAEPPEALLGQDPEQVLESVPAVECPLSDGRVLLVLIGKDPIENQLRQANFDLQQALRAAKSANEAKSSFLSNMSHDIRTPMNAIMGMTDIALNHLDEKSRVQDCLHKIQTASTHLMSLINDVLDMSRIDSGRATVNEELFSLADLVHDLTVLMRPLADAKHQTMTLDVESIEHEALMGDALYLRQVFVNIVSNAIKYTPDGGAIHVSFSERPGADDKQVLLDFACRDNGVGMSKEFLQRIYLPFERAKNTTLGKVEGTGLGMAITRSLVEKMSGSIQVESELGVGSLFTVTLPLSIADGETEGAEPLAGKSILLVERNDALAAQVTSYLHRGGAAVEVTHADTDTVIWITQAQFEGSIPDAVLLGSSMDRGAMLSLATHLRSQLGDRVPILLMLEGDWGQLEYAAKRSGVTGFVPCPVFKGRLFQAICQQDKEAEDDARPDFSDLRLLLAEDNALNREIALELIGETGAHVDAVEDGQQAVDAFSASAEGYYDLILMDIQMPVMDGYEAVRCIRALDRSDAGTVTIAAMTANAFVEDIKKSRAAGMNEHLSKPVDIRQIEELMRRCKR